MRRREIEAGLTSWDGEVTRQPFCRRSPGRRQSHVVVADGTCGVGAEAGKVPRSLGHWSTSRLLGERSS